MNGLQQAYAAARERWQALETSRVPIFFVGAATCGRAAGAGETLDRLRAEIRARNAKYLNARDAAYKSMKSRTGKVYVLDFKATGQFLSTVATKKGVYNLGIIYMYPGGLDPIKFDDVELSAITGPAEINQLYYIRTIDTRERKGSEPLKVEGVSQPDGSWKTAVVQTPLFTLKAPHVRIQESGNLIKIQVLARVK